EAAHLGDDGGRWTQGGGLVASAVSPPGRRRRPGGRGEGGVPSMPPRRATTVGAPCALDGAASRLHVPSAFATVGALERCPSGRRGTPGERVYPQGTEGSNPSLSACPTHLGARPVLAARRAAARFRCPQTPSASLSALALGLPLIWGARPLL